MKVTLLATTPTITPTPFTTPSYITTEYRLWKEESLQGFVLMIYKDIVYIMCSLFTPLPCDGVNNGSNRSITHRTNDFMIWSQFIFQLNTSFLSNEKSYTHLTLTVIHWPWYSNLNFLSMSTNIEDVIFSSASIMVRGLTMQTGTVNVSFSVMVASWCTLQSP